MHAVSEAPGTIEGDQHTRYHCQHRWHPGSNFVVPQQLLRQPDGQVINRRLSVNAATQGLPYRCHMGKTGYENSEDFVDPEQPMPRNVEAAGKIECRQPQGRQAGPVIGITRRPDLGYLDDFYCGACRYPLECVNRAEWRTSLPRAGGVTLQARGASPSQVHAFQDNTRVSTERPQKSKLGLAA